RPGVGEPRAEPRRGAAADGEPPGSSSTGRRRGRSARGGSRQSRCRDEDRQGEGGRRDARGDLADSHRTPDLDGRCREQEGRYDASLLHAGRRRAARGERVEVDTNAAIDRFLEHGGLADSTRLAYGFDLRAFSVWLDLRGLT